MIKLYHTIQSYLDDTLDFLIKNPVKNNIILGQCLGYSDKEKIVENLLLVNVINNDNIVLTAFKNSPNLAISGSNYSSEDITQLEAYIKKNYNLPQGVIGETFLTEEFSKQYYPDYTIRKKLLSYRLEKINTIELSEGEMNICEMKNIDLISDWLYKFQIECTLPYAMNREKTKEDTIKKIEQRKLYQWEVNGQIVSICGAVASNQYFSKISLVYTPFKFRKKNYARSCVWSLTNKLLKEGHQTICLFTEKANPSSNKIYQEIGFQFVNEDSEIKF